MSATEAQGALDRIRGIIVVTLNGEQRTIKFGINALALLEELIGPVTAEKLALHGTFRSMAYAGLFCGGKFSGKPWELDIWDTGDVIDQLSKEDRDAIVKAFVDSMPRKASEEKKN